MVRQSNQFIKSVVCFAVIVWFMSAASSANATPPSCVSFLVKWEPLIEIVSQHGSSDAVKRFRTLEKSFVHKTYCPANVPAGWQDIRSGMLSESLRELVTPWLRQGHLNRVTALFEDINQVKSLRGFEDSHGTNSSWTGCTEVSLELQVKNNMYVISMDHIYSRWDKCPVEFQKNSMDRITSIYYTGVPVR